MDILAQTQKTAIKMIRGMKHLPHKDRMRVGVVHQPKEEKALGRPCSSMPVPKEGPTRKSEGGTFYKGM